MADTRQQKKQRYYIMRIERGNTISDFLARLIFLILPTVVISYYILLAVNVRFAILQNEALQQSSYVALGMVVAAQLYSFRVRFIPTFLLMAVGLYSVYAGIDNYATGEVDAFFMARKFQVFAILVTIGWILGNGFIRIRYFALGIATLVLASSIALLSSAKIESVGALVRGFVPAFAFAVYIIFAAEQIYHYTEKNKRFWWFMLGRLAIFGGIFAIIFSGVVYLMYGELKETIANYGGGGSQGNKSSMLKKNKDNTFDLNDYTKLSHSLNRDKELLFCAHINNFFPGTNYPNPLYLTAFYFTKFDTSTETFERDKHIPYNDLFMPDPSSIPLFGTKIDTSVVHNSLGDLARNVVEVEIYNCKLNPRTYLAPNVGYFVQPITVEKDFRNKFISAYRTKSYVSALNSAYFVYNMDTPVIRQFQEHRFAILRSVLDYKGVDSTFMAYYTQMPQSEKFNFIGQLAHKITDTATTPVDKVVSIRNYFLSKDEHGGHLYTYTDNPGEPDIPNASKLLYFLKDNHKGYCAYYAGATLFMLRSIGIPSRIAVGFLTEDRSDKNKGWYWYYANQAHAWVQVYFPGYGWLDFDNTVGNTDENRPTPQPDGTPPMQPPKAWFAAEGQVIATDTAKRTMQFLVRHIVFHDKEYPLHDPISMNMDMKVATIYMDSVVLPLRQLKSGDSGTVVSYAEALKEMPVVAEESGIKLTQRLPVPIPADEVYLKKALPKLATHKNKKQPSSGNTNKWWLLSLIVSISMLLVLLILLTPRMIWWYYKNRFNKYAGRQSQPYWAYKASTYYVHMMGVMRGQLTPMQYASRIVDARYNTAMKRFMSIYLKQKYAGQPLSVSELEEVHEYLGTFITKVQSQEPKGRSFIAFLRLGRMVQYFLTPEEAEKEM